MGRLGQTGFALTLGAALLAAQAQKPDPVFRVDVDLVRLLVTVKNEQGQLVGSLGKDDFRVSDSDVPQDIAVFERQTEQPLSIALLVDTSGSTAKDLKYSVESAGRFLRALVREGNPRDALALFSFNHEVALRTSFTRNAKRVDQALDRLAAEAGTSLYDALILASDMLEERDGRKVIVVITDGGDTTSYRSYQDALRAVHDVDAVIYSIVVVPVTNDAGRNTGGENALITLSRSTGGQVFFPSVGPALDAAFKDILEALRTQYMIGYYPKNLPHMPAGFRKVRIELQKDGLQAFGRDGYYGR
ncbi:MAG: VWA domain-containing protein [Bryobacteraceae bacterium]